MVSEGGPLELGRFALISTNFKYFNLHFVYLIQVSVRFTGTGTLLLLTELSTTFRELAAMLSLKTVPSQKASRYTLVNRI